MGDKIIMYGSEQAARLVEVKGWVSSNGLFFGADEHNARWNGSTHDFCECGQVKEKQYVRCESCISIRQRERYDALEYKEWDGITPLCTFDTQEFFYTEDDIDDYCADNECLASDLMLVIATPNYLKTIDPYDYYDDVRPDDAEDFIPNNIIEMFNVLNKAIEECDTPISWMAGKCRTSMEDQDVSIL